MWQCSGRRCYGNTGERLSIPVHSYSICSLYRKTKDWKMKDRSCNARHNAYTIMCMDSNCPLFVQSSFSALCSLVLRFPVLLFSVNAYRPASPTTTTAVHCSGTDDVYYESVGVVMRTRKLPVEVARIPVTTTSQPLCAGPSGPGIPAEACGE